MDCEHAQEILRALHGPEIDRRQVNGEKMTVCLVHLRICPYCKSWVYGEICPIVKEQNEKGELDEEAYMIHGLLHGDGGALGRDCIAAPEETKRV